MPTCIGSNLGEGSLYQPKQGARARTFTLWECDLRATIRKGSDTELHIRDPACPTDLDALRGLRYLAEENRPCPQPSLPPPSPAGTASAAAGKYQTGPSW